MKKTWMFRVEVKFRVEINTVAVSQIRHNATLQSENILKSDRTVTPTCTNK